MTGIVERFLSNKKVGGGVRSDLFGLFDLVSMSADEGIIGVQACGTDFSPHVRKITQENAENALTWLAAGGKIELWGWRKLKVKRGGKAYQWKPRIKVITSQTMLENRK